MALERSLSLTSATIGVVTARPKEFIAACEVLGCFQEVFADGRVHRLGIVRRRDNSGAHVVVVCQLPDMGNNASTARTIILKHVCPHITDVIMCGMAGAVPNPTNAAEHVRLGDIVVSNFEGVIQYDFVRETEQGIEHRPRPRPPSRRLLEIAQLLEAEEEKGQRPWDLHIQQTIDVLAKDEVDSKWRRPPAEHDLLREFDPSHKYQSSFIGLQRLVGRKLDPPKIPDWPTIPHPNDPHRKADAPRVFYGPIASANNLQKNSIRREQLRKKFRVKAVEMEGSGVAEAVYQVDTDYLIVRGTVDYCNAYKNDTWHNYASIVAAAYTRALLEATPLAPLAIEQPNATTSAARQSRVAKVDERATSPGTEVPAGDVLQKELEKILSGMVDDQAKRRIKAISDEIDSWDHDTAVRLGSELELWFEQNERKVSRETRRDIYLCLVRVELVRSAEAERSGETHDTTRAEQFLARAKDVQ